MRTLAAFASIALALAACEQKGAPPATSTAAASLRVVDDAGRPGPFALGPLRRLHLDASVPAAPGPHTVRIDVFRPDGGVHASLTATAEAGPDGVAALRQTLEVAGSPIEQYHLVGTWSFALKVDGGPQLATARAALGD